MPSYARGICFLFCCRNDGTPLRKDYFSDFLGGGGGTLGAAGGALGGVTALDCPGGGTAPGAEADAPGAGGSLGRSFPHCVQIIASSELTVPQAGHLFSLF